MQYSGVESTRCLRRERVKKHWHKYRLKYRKWNRLQANGYLFVINVLVRTSCAHLISTLNDNLTAMCFISSSTSRQCWNFHTGICGSSHEFNPRKNRFMCQSLGRSRHLFFMLQSLITFFINLTTRLNFSLAFCYSFSGPVSPAELFSVGTASPVVRFSVSSLLRHIISLLTCASHCSFVMHLGGDEWRILQRPSEGFYIC